MEFVVFASCDPLPGVETILSCLDDRKIKLSAVGMLMNSLDSDASFEALGVLKQSIEVSDIYELPVDDDDDDSASNKFNSNIPNIELLLDAADNHLIHLSNLKSAAMPTSDVSNNEHPFSYIQCLIDASNGSFEILGLLMEAGDASSSPVKVRNTDHDSDNNITSEKEEDDCLSLQSHHSNPKSSNQPELAAALAIQLAFRVMKARRRVLHRKKLAAQSREQNYSEAAEEYATILLQSWIRGYLVRKLMARNRLEKEQATASNDLPVENQQSEEVVDLKEEEQEDNSHKPTSTEEVVPDEEPLQQQGEPSQELAAALAIQLAFRVMQSKRRANTKREEQTEQTDLKNESPSKTSEEFACILIQSWVRGILVRKAIEEKKTSKDELPSRNEILKPDNCKPTPKLSGRKTTPPKQQQLHGLELMSELCGSDDHGISILLLVGKSPETNSDSSPPPDSVGSPVETTPKSTLSNKLPAPSQRWGKVSILKHDPLPSEDYQYHHASYSPDKAVPYGKRLTFVLLAAMNADDPAWDLEQSPSKISIAYEDVERLGVAVDEYYDKITPFGLSQPNGPFASEVYSNDPDKCFTIEKDTMVDQRDSSVIVSFYKGEVLSKVLSVTTNRANDGWVHCYRSTAIQDLGTEAVLHRVKRQLSDIAAKQEGTLSGLKKRNELYLKRAPPPSHVVEQMRSEAAEAHHERNLTKIAQESLLSPTPDEIREIQSSGDSYMVGMTFNDIALGTCVGQDVTLMSDASRNISSSSIPIHAIFAPSMPNSNVTSSVICDLYRLVLTAAEQRGHSICCISPLLQVASIAGVAHPQRLIALHLMALGQVLCEKNFGLKTIYVCCFEVPVEIARRAFEKATMKTSVVLHNSPSLSVSQRLTEPNSLVIPSDPLSILCGRIGYRWMTSRGKSYRQEEDIVASSTAFLLQSQFTTLYQESIRHFLANKAEPILQKATPVLPRRHLRSDPTQNRTPNTAAGGAVHSLSKQALADRVIEENEARKQFLSKMEEKEEVSVAKRHEVKKLQKERDERIKDRQIRRVRDLELQLERQRDEAEKEERARKERNRRNQEAAEMRRQRQLEIRERMERDREDQRIVQEAQQAAELRKRANRARRLKEGEKIREEHRQKQRVERVQQQQDDRIERERATQEADEKHKERQREVRRYVFSSFF